MEAKEVETGGPAFPTGKQHLERLAGTRYAHRVVSDGSGMTLRDYFAAKAMQSMVNSGTYEVGGWDQRDIAIQSYQMADAMLAQRTK
ncbi:hypothetical protein MCB86_09005 [Pseudomonas sp. KSR10]|uniref:hypothetical protein n=1 Tax=Pseudomonas sp. KSR10 TaxID=2916654 RepID=UPI001EF96AA8|nr:hypothetical protein [Pseudomonas sp. KSR10]MCG6540212.1 hypothetical protein [Pseudomonas sp. KSR10]